MNEKRKLYTFWVNLEDAEIIERGYKNYVARKMQTGSVPTRSEYIRDVLFRDALK